MIAHIVISILLILIAAGNGFVAVLAASDAEGRGGSIALRCLAVAVASIICSAMVWFV